MDLCKRILRLLAFLLGVVGLVACVAAIVVAWNLHARVGGATEEVFDTLDAALAAAGDDATGRRRRPAGSSAGSLRGARGLPCSTACRYGANGERLQAAMSSGRPLATTFPPRSPPPGPRSIT